MNIMYFTDSIGHVVGLDKHIHTPNLKSISQSITELWPYIGFDHIWWSVGYAETDNLKKTT